MRTRAAAVTWWGMPGTRLPMFPLSAVLFPHASMPLHVFEPRYRVLMRDCLAGDARFGIVLIERGSEVGGGDERSALGTRGVITEAAELPDGRWVLEVRGEALDRGGRMAARRPLPGGAGARVAGGAGTGGRRTAGGCRRATGPPGPGPAGGAGRRATPAARAGARRRGGRRCGVLAALRGGAPDAYDAQRLLAADGAAERCGSWPS